MKLDAVRGQFLMLEDDIKSLFPGLLQGTGSQVFIVAPDGQVLACLSKDRAADMIALDTSRLVGDKGSFKQMDGKERLAAAQYTGAGAACRSRLKRTTIRGAVH